MHRIDTTNKAVDLFGAGKHGWRDGNKALGINATEFNAAMMNMIQEELAALPEGVGMTLDANNRTQVREAIKRMIDAQAGNYALDTGAANAYVVALDPAITAYEGGMTVRVKAVNANNGASTLNAGGGAVALVNDAGGALADGDIAAGSIFAATYIASANKFYITSMVQSQGDARYAKLAGLSTQAFESADGSTGKQVVNISQFAASLTGSGYQKLPGGLIIQWGSVTPVNGALFNFPTSFPNACLWHSWGGAKHGLYDAGGSFIGSMQATSITNSNFVMALIGSGLPDMYFAVGH